MKLACSALLVLAALVGGLSRTAATAAEITPGQSATSTQSAAATQRELVGLRDDFIQGIKASGLTPRLPPPTILMDNPPSLGDYDDATNILHTGEWQTLAPELQEVFVHQAQAAANGKSGEWMFEQSVHRWIFVHELGHWWRACRSQKSSFYDEEMAANRIATAYWRERDPKLMALMLKIFERFLVDIPNPLPDGQSAEAYLNEHYQSLGGRRAYTWLQSKMVVDIQDERPIWTFKQAIERSGNKP